MRINEVCLGLALLVVGVVVVGSFYPALDDLWVGNPGWNGLSEFYHRVEPVRVHELDTLIEFDPLHSTLFLVGPSRGFSGGDVAAIQGFLDDGGRVVLLDDFGSGNELLAGLGLETRFDGGLLRDGVFFDPRPEFPRLLNFSFYEVEELVLNYGTVLDLGERGVVLISSSPMSYVNGSEGVVVGEFPVVAAVNVGNGLLVLVSDSSLWLNSMIDRGDNGGLLGDLLYGVALVDVGHSVPTRLLAFQWWLGDVYGFLGLLEMRYTVVVWLIFFVFILRYKTDSDTGVDVVEAVLDRHPDWSRERLRWLLETRE